LSQSPIGSLQNVRSSPFFVLFSSASCCPYGCDEYAILHADAATLADLEQEAEEAVQDANEELRRARAEVHRRSPIKEPDNFGPDVQESVQNEKEVDEEGHCKEGTPDVESVGHIGEQVDIGSPVSRRASILSQRWKEAEKLVGSERNVMNKGDRRKKYRLDNGHWPNPFKSWSDSPMCEWEEVGKKLTSEAPSRIIDTDSYAVVTFTSRQAAIAARQCLADGCGLDRWREIDFIPIPPLADAPPWNILGMLLLQL